MPRPKGYKRSLAAQQRRAEQLARERQPRGVEEATAGEVKPHSTSSTSRQEEDQAVVVVGSGSPPRPSYADMVKSLPPVSSTFGTEENVSRESIKPAASKRRRSQQQIEEVPGLKKRHILPGSSSSEMDIDEVPETSHCGIPIPDSTSSIYRQEEHKPAVEVRHRHSCSRSSPGAEIRPRSPASFHPALEEDQAVVVIGSCSPPRPSYADIVKSLPPVASDEEGDVIGSPAVAGTSHSISIPDNIQGS